MLPCISCHQKPNIFSTGKVTVCVAGCQAQVFDLSHSFAPCNHLMRVAKSDIKL